MKAFNNIYGWLMRRLLFILAVTVLLTNGACGGPAVIWSSQVSSPNGRWLALAECKQYSGPGNDYLETIVRIRGIDNPKSIMTIADFNCQECAVPHPYAHDNIANAGGLIGLKMKWSAPNHLLITYRDNPNIVLEVARLWGIHISYKHLR